MVNLLKRVLIYFGDDLKPIGGPCGYLYSLMEGYKLLPQTDIKIDLLPNNEQLKIIKQKSKENKNPLMKTVLKKYRAFKLIKSLFKTLYYNASPVVDLKDYDVVHFHSSRDLYSLRKALDDFRGTVLLTSHSPQPQSKEFFELAKPLERKLFKKQFSKLIEMDEYSFRNADLIIFPCEDADEPYSNAWPGYNEIKIKRKEAYRYMLTGTIKPDYLMSRDEFREKYGIPKDAFLISYVGRHNEIKGYGRLQKICLQLFQKYDNVYVVVAGNLGPIKSPDHPHWIEMGWTNDPHSLTNASDVFILPNKETYFDLVLLELLSLGVLVVASNTGGNKFFSDTEGVKLFKDNEECLSIIESIMNYDVSTLETLRNSNKKLYEELFTPEKFASRYVQLIKSI